MMSDAQGVRDDACDEGVDCHANTWNNGPVCQSLGRQLCLCQLPFVRSRKPVLVCMPGLGCSVSHWVYDAQKVHMQVVLNSQKLSANINLCSNVSYIDSGCTSLTTITPLDSFVGWETGYVVLAYAHMDIGFSTDSDFTPISHRVRLYVLGRHRNIDICFILQARGYYFA
eukprot:GHRR01009163.1.p1 GENE.GHRR01009163.1~~GHRR01009163.1.p1  ORF type:complete len:170 (+),score=12.09 GHRR01009163.1:763-1272(+)